MQTVPVFLIVIVVFALIILSNAIRILREYERGVIFRLGRLTGNGGVKGPGLILLIPIIDKMVKVSLRTVVMLRAVVGRLNARAHIAGVMVESLELPRVRQ